LPRLELASFDLCRTMPVHLPRPLYVLLAAMSCGTSLPACLLQIDKQYLKASSVQQVEAKPTAPPLEPLKKSRIAISDFPVHAPVQLAREGRTTIDNTTLAGGPLTQEATGLRIDTGSASFALGKKVYVADANGSYVFATEPELLSIQWHTHFYDARTGGRLAFIKNSMFPLHHVWEAAAYDPVCPTQDSQGQSYKNVPLYSFARLKRKPFKFYTQWTLERYKCDGSLELVWDISPRYWSATKVYYNFFEPGTVDPVATLDETGFLSLPYGYNGWLTKHEDLKLFALTTLMMDLSMEYMKKQ